MTVSNVIMSIWLYAIIGAVLLWRTGDADPIFNLAMENEVTANLNRFKEGITGSVGTLECTDTDPGSIRMTVVKDTNYVAIRQRGNSAEVFVIKQLNHEDELDQNGKVIEIICLNRGTNIQALFEAKLITIDVNDVVPIFTSPRFEFSIPEVLRGRPPHLISASEIEVYDGDREEDNNRVYPNCTTLLKGSEIVQCDDYFRFETNQTGPGRFFFNLFAINNVYSVEPHVLTVIAENPSSTPGDPHLSSAPQNVIVRVIDIQNKPPTIDVNSLQHTIKENHIVGTRIGGPVKARDQDRGDPHYINFTLALNPDDPYGWEGDFFELGPVRIPLEGDEEDWFEVEVLLKNPIDREQIPGIADSVSINIVAQEYDIRGRPNRNEMQTVGTISVTIQDINDEAPNFAQDEYSVEVPEITGTIIPEQENIRQQILPDISVTDLDASPFNRFEVAFVEGNDQDLFSLDKYLGSRSRNFILYAKRAVLDFERPENRARGNTYTLVLQATDLDRNELISRTTITLTVKDVNDNWPRFDLRTYIFTLPENSDSGSVLGQVQATDADDGDTVTYAIQGDNRFVIDPETGEITLNGQVDFESRPSYQVSLSATDAVGNQDTVNANIQVININDVGPQFPPTGYLGLLYEDTTIINPEIVIEAQNAESNQQIEYGINSVDPVGLTNFFTMDRISGRLTLLRKINYKLTNDGIITLEFIASAGSLSSTTFGIITVIDENNFPPQFLPIPANPNDPIIYYTEISELAKPGQMVYEMPVQDLDGLDGPFPNYGKVVFTITSGGFDNFNIGFDNGIIIVSNTSQLDVEDRDQYEIVVRARDLGVPVMSSTATVMINILDDNNKPPVFDETVLITTVKESPDPDDFVPADIVAVRAVDPDGDSRVQYSLSFLGASFQKNSDNITAFINGSEYFGINPDTGMLRVVGPIRRSLFDRVIFKVVAEDVNVPEGQPRQITTMDVRITILASDEQRIYFHTDKGTVISPILQKDYPETELGSLVQQIFSLRAVDPNVSREVTTYREAPGVDIGNYFEVQSRYVNLRRNLDFDTMPGNPPKTLSTVVYAISDDRLRTGTATCIINVLDINDNDPLFQELQYIFEVDELKVAPFRLGSVRATDIDSSSYGQITYTISGPKSQDFEIYTEQTGTYSVGVVRINKSAELDYETTPIYNLQVIARDNPTGRLGERRRATVPLTINVLDANDNPPIFEELIYNFTVVGTTVEGTLSQGGDIGIIKANDLDRGKNGEVEYFIESSTNGGQSFFGIRTDSLHTAAAADKLYVGQLYVRRPLASLPDLSRFVLTVQARDNVGHSPQLTGQTTVIITVSKGVKDPKPKWDAGLNSTISIYENSTVGTFVTKLTARPANDSSGIKYKFITAGSEDVNKFAIDENTGVITVAGDLDYETQKVFSLLILATDTTNNTLTNQFLLVVRILDVDDNLPSFLSCPNKRYNIPEVVRVNEEVEPELFVYQARACDLDTQAYNAKLYKWFYDDTHCNPSTSTAFRLDENNGRIYTKVKLNREVTPDYLLCVQVAPRPRGGAAGRRRRGLVEDLRARDNHDTVLYVHVIVSDINDNGPIFGDRFLQTVILEYPPISIGVAEATDLDLPPNNGIRYSLDSIMFVIGGKSQSQPAAFSINGNDGTIITNDHDYSDFVNGYFEITVRASDLYNGELHDQQTQRVYVTNQYNQVRVVFDEPADSDVDQKAKDMVDELNGLNRLYYQIKSISFHIIDNEQDPSFDRTDVCMIVLKNEFVLSATDGSKEMNADQENRIIRKYGARDPGPCEPAKSIYPEGWESYWWVLVAFAIFIFILVLILIVLICILHRQYKNYMDTRQTYLVPGN